MNNAGFNTNLQSFINKENWFYSRRWHKSGPIDSHKHFMCTVWDSMELVRNVGQVGRARHEISLDQLGQATEFRISYRIASETVVETCEYLGP